jgi:hypothetical protein
VESARGKLTLSLLLASSQKNGASDHARRTCDTQTHAEKIRPKDPSHVASIPRKIRPTSPQSLEVTRDFQIISQTGVRQRVAVKPACHSV